MSITRKVQKLNHLAVIAEGEVETATTFKTVALTATNFGGIGTTPPKTNEFQVTTVGGGSGDFVTTKLVAEQANKAMAIQNAALQRNAENAKEIINAMKDCQEKIANMEKMLWTLDIKPMQLKGRYKYVN